MQSSVRMIFWCVLGRTPFGESPKGCWHPCELTSVYEEEPCTKMLRCDTFGCPSCFVLLSVVGTRRGNQGSENATSGVEFEGEQSDSLLTSLTEENADC